MTAQARHAAGLSHERIRLPPPSRTGAVPLEIAVASRRSVREFAEGALTLGAVGQILWAAQGVSHATGYRTAPSAGALYPLETGLVAGDVAGLPPGVYRYEPGRHALRSAGGGDRRRRLAAAALGQAWIAEAPATLVFAAVYDRTLGKYGERGIRYVHQEAGHAAQNACLQAVALGLGTAVVGAFQDSALREAVGLADDETPLAILPFGEPIER